jgi:hypothetical protein
MKWTHEEIESAIRNLMNELQIDRMPTSTEIRGNRMTGLSRAIGLNGGMYYWSEKLDLPMKEKEKLWNNQRIEEQIRRSISVLQINRMPTAQELTSIGRNDLHCAISKSTQKYSGWAKDLNLQLKSCDTRTGQKYELEAENLLVQRGYKVGQMTTKFPYDILVEDFLKVDVKAGKAYTNFGERYFTFRIAKEKPTCDIYFCFTLDESEKIENILIIPSHFVKVKTLTFRDNNVKWMSFKDKWLYIDQYLEFFKTIKHA